MPSFRQRQRSPFYKYKVEPAFVRDNLWHYCVMGMELLIADAQVHLWRPNDPPNRGPNHGNARLTDPMELVRKRYWEQWPQPTAEYLAQGQITKNLRGAVRVTERTVC